jgi:transposase
MHYQQGQDRNQIMMISLDQMVADDSFARIIDLFVDAMPIEELGFEHVKLNKEGNIPYHPRDMFRLLMYGYRNGIRSANKLAKACSINMEVMWLMKGLQPSPRTINYFRSNNSKAIENANRHFIKLLKQWKLVDGKTIAVDGTKVRGQNSLKNNFNLKKINRHIDYLDKKMGDYLDQEQVAEQQLKGKKLQEKKDELNAKMDDLVNREDRFEELKEQVDQSHNGQVSLTDPDSRAVIKHRGIVEVGYNIQTTVDAKNKIILDQFAGGVNDLNDLGKAVKRTQQTLDIKKMNVLADAGYYNGAEIAYVERLGAKPYVSPREPTHQKQEGYRKSDFSYDRLNDIYICPQGHQLKHILTFRRGSKRKYNVKRYTTPNCNNCPVRDHCTSSIHGRYIERPSHQNYVERNNNRVNKNKDYYRQRQTIVEHPFGTFKRHWGMTHVMVRGRKNVETEYRLAAICYNLQRSLSILGHDTLIKRLETLIRTILGSFVSLKFYMNSQHIIPVMCRQLKFSCIRYHRRSDYSNLGVIA